MKTIHILLFLLVVAFGIQAQDSTPLSESKFESLRKDIEAQSYDSKRLEKAKEVSDAHYLYVKQIDAIIKVLSLSGNKLEYAKYAYSSTLDAENYDQLMSNFRRDSEKEELKTYVSKREPPVISKKEPAKTTDADNKTNSTTSSTVSTTKTTTTTTIKKSSGPVPMTDADFAKAKRDVDGESYESKKLQRAKQVSDANYLLCSQIVELMSVLSFESSRLEYSQYAYAKTYDQANYEVVKEGLKHSKSKDELAAFLKKQTVNDYTVKEEVVVENTSDNSTNNTAAAGISNDDFAQIKAAVSSQSSDTKKLEEATKFASRASFSAAQVKEIVELFIFEENRLEFAKAAYPKTLDKGSYEVVKASLEKESREALDAYIKTAPKAEQTTDATATVSTKPSELSADDFAALLKKIKGQSLESHKLDKAKIVVDRAKVNTTQIKQIVELMDKEETRLEFAKYAYPRTLDKDNYEVVRKTLYKSTSRYSLDRFIKDNK